jgi:hypothetical protein
MVRKPGSTTARDAAALRKGLTLREVAAQRRAVAAKRRVDRLQKRGAVGTARKTPRGQIRCECCECGAEFGSKKRACPPSYCAACTLANAARVTIYDRDLKVGSLPPNLARYLVQ